MADKEEVQGEGHGLDEILKQAAAGVLRKAEDEKSALRQQIGELREENKFLRGQSAERRLELQFTPKGKIPVGEQEMSIIRIGENEKFPRRMVAIQSNQYTAKDLEELRAQLPDDILLLGLPVGSEVSILEIVPKREE